jgi:oligosaccharide repeat unit polymerase
MVSILFFSIAVLIVLLTIIKKADILAPARVFGIIWCVALGLTDLKLSSFQHPWSYESWLMVLLGPLSYCLGFFIAYVMNIQSTLLPISQIRQLSKEFEINSNRLFILTSVAFGFYAGGYLIIYWVVGFVPLFSPLLGAVRGEFTMFGLGMSVHTMPLIVFFSVVFHLTTPGEKIKKHILKLFSFCSLVTFFFLLQRFQIIMIGVMCIILLYYTTRIIRPSTGFVIFAGVSSFFLWVSTLRSGKFFIQYLHSESKMKTPREYAIFTEPYMYIVMNLENLARSVEKIEYHTYGYYTFNFVLSFVGLKHWIAEYTYLDDTPYLISGYNTYTAFWTYYRDFGVIGLALIPLLLGLAIGMLYYSLRKQPSLQKISAYALSVFVLFISFFNSPFGYLWFMWTVIGMIVIYYFIKLPQEGRLGYLKNAAISDYQ